MAKSADAVIQIYWMQGAKHWTLVGIPPGSDARPITRQVTVTAALDRGAMRSLLDAIADEMSAWLPFDQS